MTSSYLASVRRGYAPSRSDNVRESLTSQFERVFFESLITSFGLDFLVRDQHGGDVDTPHTVREMDRDPRLTYKDPANKAAWEARGSYDSAAYHRHPGYIEQNRKVSELRKAGLLTDAYTGEPISRNGRTDLDHVISASEFHNDRGRVLAGLRGEDLANSPENLYPTNPHTNRSKKHDSMERYLEKHGDEYTEEQRNRMLGLDARARSAATAKISTAYYTSPAFWQNTVTAAGNLGVRMGLRQVLGFVLAEIWFAVRESFAGCGSTLKEMLRAAARGVRIGITRARAKFRTLLDRFADGMVSGILASLTTTLCNIFFTTGRNLIRILRQSYTSIVAAGRVLFFNPDNLPFGDRMLAVLTILAAGASAVVGFSVTELVRSTGLGGFPEVGDILATFAGVFTAGALSCLFVHFLDSSATVRQLVDRLNRMRTIGNDLAFYRTQADEFERQLETLAGYDLEGFRNEVETWKASVRRIETAAGNQAALSRELDSVIAQHNLIKPYTGSFDEFMSDKRSRLRSQ